MKKLFMALMAVTLMVGMATGAVAAPSSTYTLSSVETVNFYLVDWGGFDNSVTLTATMDGGASKDLQYSLDNHTWVEFSAVYSKAIDETYYTATVPSINAATHTQLVYLRLLTEQSAQSMTFQSYSENSENKTSPANLDLYTGLIVNFNGTDVVFATNAGNDKFAAVPIPAAVWLFGTGLAGLVGLRRRFHK